MTALTAASVRANNPLERHSSPSSSTLSTHSIPSTSSPHSSLTSSSVTLSSSHSQSMVKTPTTPTSATLLARSTSSATMEEGKKPHNSGHTQPTKTNNEHNSRAHRYYRRIMQDEDIPTSRNAFRMVVLPPAIPNSQIRPRVRREPRQRKSPRFEAEKGELPSHVTVRPLSSHNSQVISTLPIPSIVVTDHSLLSSAITRYASSPRCLSRIRPYHHVTDPRFLTRGPMMGVNTISFEVVDVKRFEEMGGQKSVVVVGGSRVGQWRVVGVGCPSGSCGCRGRGVAMGGCGDLREEYEVEVVEVVGDDDDEEDASPASDGVAGGRVRGRVRTMLVTDRIEEAQKMRTRIDERRQKKLEIVSSEGSGGEVKVNAVGSVAKTAVKGEPGRTKTVRRKKSRFTEIGCTPGDDSMETVCSVVDVSKAAAKRARGVSAESAGSRSKQSGLVRRPVKRKKGSWIRKLLRI